MRNSELSPETFFDTFSDNLLQWIDANRPHLKPVNWLCQRGYRCYLYGEDLFHIGTGLQVGMPSQLTVCVNRPAETPSPLKPLTQAFRSVKPTVYGKAFYMSQGYKINLVPISTLYWNEETNFYGRVEKLPWYLWKCATFSIQSCAASIALEPDGLHGFWVDDDLAIYQSVSTKTLSLQPRFNADARNPKYVNWVRGYALQWLEDHPDWTLGESLQQLVHGKSLLPTGMEDAAPRRPAAAPVRLM